VGGGNDDLGNFTIIVWIVETTYRTADGSTTVCTRILYTVDAKILIIIRILTLSSMISSYGSTMIALVLPYHLNL
jgi:hypothetical protein